MTNTLITKLEALKIHDTNHIPDKRNNAMLDRCIALVREDVTCKPSLQVDDTLIERIKSLTTLPDGQSADISFDKVLEILREYKISEIPSGTLIEKLKAHIRHLEKCPDFDFEAAFPDCQSEIWLTEDEKRLVEIHIPAALEMMFKLWPLPENEENSDAELVWTALSEAKEALERRPKREANEISGDAGQKISAILNGPDPVPNARELKREIVLPNDLSIKISGIVDDHATEPNLYTLSEATKDILTLIETAGLAREIVEVSDDDVKEALRKRSGMAQYVLNQFYKAGYRVVKAIPSITTQTRSFNENAYNFSSGYVLGYVVQQLFRGKVGLQSRSVDTAARASPSANQHRNRRTVLMRGIEEWKSLQGNNFRKASYYGDNLEEFMALVELADSGLLWETESCGPCGSDTIRIAITNPYSGPYPLSDDPKCEWTMGCEGSDGDLICAQHNKAIVALYLKMTKSTVREDKS